MERWKQLKIPVWGLTGGIGSGKSLAAKFFQDEGISVINLDFLGKEIIDKDPSVHEQLKIIFGSSILLNDQTPDKQKIREIIFKDSSKRLKLEAVLHPLIWKRFEETAIEEEHKGAKLILCEAALFIEHNHAKLFPRLIVVLADTETRKERVRNRDHLSTEIIDQILKTQVSDQTRKEAATDILMNNGTPDQLKTTVKNLIEDWKKKSLI